MASCSFAALRRTAWAAGIGLVTLSAVSAHAECGDPNKDGKISTADALYTLRAGVGDVGCILATCDVDLNGTINVTDALKVLRVATGLPPALACATDEPVDPLYGDLWGLPYLGAPSVWPTRTDCSNVIVAVIDTGVDYYHDDLVGNLWRNPGEIPHNHEDDDDNGHVDDVYGYDFSDGDEYPWDFHGHGTHVSGTIGATANDIGVVGVCWEAQIMTVRFLGDDGFGFTSDGLQAVDYARKNGAKVINNSWGGGPYDSGLYFAFKAASDADISLIVAAGNDGNDVDKDWDYPGHFLHLTQLNVAAMTEDGGLAGFSNYGATTVHVGAPGVGILSSVPYDDYGTNEGTSMAAPHVSGAVALLRSEFPNLDAISIQRLVQLSAAPNEDLLGMVVSDGTVDLEAAFEMAETWPAFAPAAASQKVEVSQPPRVRERKVLERFSDSSRKYSKLQRAEETYTDGRKKAATMVADHVIVTLEDSAALQRLEDNGFKIRRRLQSDRVAVLVEAPDGIDETQSALEGIAGVQGVSPDYLVSIR